MNLSHVPQAQSKFVSTQLDLESSHAGIHPNLCGPRSDYMWTICDAGMICLGNESTHLNIQIHGRTDGEWQLYANAQGVDRFNCDKTKKACTIPLEPAVVATRIRLDFRCLGNSNKFIDPMSGKKQTWQAEKGYTPGNGNGYLMKNAVKAGKQLPVYPHATSFYGFADTKSLGKNVQLRIALKVPLINNNSHFDVPLPVDSGTTRIKGFCVFGIASVPCTNSACRTCPVVDSYHCCSQKADHTITICGDLQRISARSLSIELSLRSANSVVLVLTLLSLHSCNIWTIHI